MRWQGLSSQAIIVGSGSARLRSRVNLSLDLIISGGEFLDLLLTNGLVKIDHPLLSGDRSIVGQIIFPSSPKKKKNLKPINLTIRSQILNNSDNHIPNT